VQNIFKKCPRNKKSIASCCLQEVDFQKMMRKRMLPTRFFQSVLLLKNVKRAGWVSKVRVNNPESVADHTYSMCAMCMVLSDMLRLDTQRVMKMVILHDLAESITGDYIPGEISKKQKLLQEKKAINSILYCLPTDIRSDYKKIWQEYISNKTEIARFVHRIDKLEMMLQAKLYAKQGYSHKLLAQFFNSADKYLSINKYDFMNLQALINTI
jgi:5'-deoxynucleotidase